MNKITGGGITVIILVILSAYIAFSKGMLSNPSSEIIKIGFIGPLTGDAASYGIPISNAVRMAVDVVNETGGVNGRPIEVIYEDGKCAETNAANAAKKLVDIDKVRAIIGGVCSGETLAMLPITEKKKVVVLSPSSSSPDLSGAGEYFFRNAPSDLKSGEKLARMIAEKYEYKKIAIISEETNYAQGLARVFRQSLQKLGVKLVAEESFAPEADDFRSILITIKNAKPEALLVNPQTEVAGGTIVKQAREIGIDAQLFGSNVLSGPRAIEVAEEHIEGLMFVDAPGLSRGNPKATAFLNEYRPKYGEPGVEFYVGAAYDNVHIIAHAIQTANTNAEKVRDHISAMKHFNGVAGNYRFDENGDPEGIDFIAKKIENGAVVEMIESE